MAPGLQPNLIFKAFVRTSFVGLSLLSSERLNEEKQRTRIAFESSAPSTVYSTRPSPQKVANCHQLYVADLSTLEVSLSEKAPPPCAHRPPYVSMMRLRSVRLPFS